MKFKLDFVSGVFPHPATLVTLYRTQLEQKKSVTPLRPRLRKSDLASWFPHVEVLFHLPGISADDSRYFLVVAALDQLSTWGAMQLLRTPMQYGKYDALKHVLLRR